MKVLGSRIVFTPQENDSKTVSGIIYERAESKIPNVGIVDFVGNECKDIKVGDRVVYSVTGATRAITHEGKEYFYVDKYTDLLMYKPSGEDDYIPVEGKLIIEEIATTEVLDSGIEIIEKEKRPTQCSKVLAAGANDKGIAVGDYVVFVVNTSNMVTADSRDYCLLKSSTVMATSDVMTN